MLQSLCDTSPEVRQAAAYGIGVMAQFGGESYRPFCTGKGAGLCTGGTSVATPREFFFFFSSSPPFRSVSLFQSAHET